MLVIRDRGMLRNMGSRSVALVLCLGILLFLDQCSCQAVPQTVLLGGDDGWSTLYNVTLNYTQWMAAVPFKAGDTLRLNNTDGIDHNVLQVYSQDDYDACNSNNNTGWTVNAGDFHDFPFPDPAYRVWIMDTSFCFADLKVEFMVLNADGTAVLPDTGADPPSLNAPPASDYVGPPPSPPAPPLSLAGGPTPNAACSSRARLNWIALLVCYLAARF